MVCEEKYIFFLDSNPIFPSSFYNSISGKCKKKGGKHAYFNNHSSPPYSDSINEKEKKRKYSMYHTILIPKCLGIIRRWECTSNSRQIRKAVKYAFTIISNLGYSRSAIILADPVVRLCRGGIMGHANHLIVSSTSIIINDMNNNKQHLKFCQVLLSLSKLCSLILSLATFQEAIHTPRQPKDHTIYQ
jgi:hypothetical protein